MSCIEKEKTIRVEVYLKETSQALQYKATNTYQKGDFYCVYVKSLNKVIKIPFQNIFIVKEDYYKD